MFGAVYELFTGRSGKWPRVRDAHLAANPKCVACLQDATTVHHIRPVSVAPLLELEPTNFASVCDRCHFCIGHLCRWNVWNDLFWQCVQMANRGRRGPVGETE
jgi:hypothetical protein